MAYLRMLLSMDLKRLWEPVRAAPQAEGPVMARLEAGVCFREGHRDREHVAEI